MSLKELEEKRNELIRELNNLKSEVEQAKHNSADDTYDNIFVDDIPIITPKTKKTNINQIDQKQKLYELYSGINIIDISIKYFPVENEGKTDTSWLKFDVDASIHKTKFHVSYISNQNLETCTQDDLISCDIKKLNITMNKQIHQIELQDCLNYFSKHPSKIGLAFDCIREYDKLFTERNIISRTITNENKDIIESSIFVEDEYADLQIIANSKKHLERQYFNIKWTIIFDKNILNMKEKFTIIVPYQEKSFMKSIRGNFTQLSTSKFVQNYGIFKPSKALDEEFIQSINSTPKEKLTCLRNTILAVKVAEDK